jgi:hypothetical protein
MNAIFGMHSVVSIDSDLDLQDMKGRERAV